MKRRDEILPPNPLTVVLDHDGHCAPCVRVIQAMTVQAMTNSHIRTIH